MPSSVIKDLDTPDGLCAVYYAFTTESLSMNGGNNKFLKLQNRFSSVLIRWIFFGGSWLLEQTLSYRKLKSCFIAATMASVPRVALVTSLLGAKAQAYQTKVMSFIVGLIHDSNNKLKPETISIVTNAIKSGATQHKTNMEVRCTNAEKVIILCKESRVKEAMDILHVMDEQGIAVDFDTYSFLLQGCGSMKALAEGKRVHAHLLTMGFERNNILAAKLISMYSASGNGNLMDARQVFEKMHKPNVCVWNAMIRVYANNEVCEEALGLYSQMEPAGVQPDKFTFPCVLKACARLSSLEKGMEIHDYITANGLDSNLSVDNALVAMYTKCGCIDEARHVFLNMREKDVVSWNTMITGYTQNGKCDEALTLFQQMEPAGVKPNSVTIASILPACARVADLDQGKQIHDYIIGSGIKSDVMVDNALIDMYAKCGSLEIARHLFDKMSRRDVVSWSAIVAGYAQNGHAEEAFEVFRQMQVTSVKPNSVTIVSILPACANVVALQQGQEVHGYILRMGLDYRIPVWNALIDMYAKCRKIEFAGLVFDKMHRRDVVSWNAMIAGYAQNGHSDEALAFFNEMQVQGIKPDSITIVSILPACAHLLALEQGKQIHGYGIRSGFECDVVVGTGLVNMYAKCGNLNIAHKLFERMPKQNVVSWTAIIAGYAQNGPPHEALAFFIEMQVEKVKPNSITMASVLPACADLMALEQGKQIHGNAIRSGFESDIAVGTALVDMYARCGHISIARQVFDNVLNRDVVSWNAMILAYGIHGHGEDALALFSQMQQTGTKPDHITFTAVLTACSHAGLVDQGWQYFECMKSDYGLAPKLEHYACLVDLLGRAGHLDEAHDIIKKMPLEPQSNVWGALLGACRIHGNIELGEQAAKHLFKLEPNNAGYYVLLSNIYAEAGRWEEVAKLRTMMKEREVKKQPGCSFIEVNREVHSFLVRDKTHPQSEKIYATLENLYGQMKKAGYVPNTNLVLHDVEEEMKEDILCSHSEKLAISFGIINTSPGIPIRIMKNLRVCLDCHNATKFICRIVGREIIVRDANRFHHFTNGLCSCGDHW